jgi:hypothetical protein
VTTIHKTSTHLLIEHRMGKSLKRLVRRKRNEELSWRRISKLIYEETGVRVTPVALRGWFKDID